MYLELYLNNRILKDIVEKSFDDWCAPQTGELHWQWAW